MIFRMRKILFITLLLSCFCSVSIYSQIVLTEPGNVTFTIDGWKWGQVIWQKSTDGNSWDDIKEATGLTYTVLVDKESWFRARLAEGTCDPILSSVAHVEIRPFVCGDTMVDNRDGQSYPTVQIGTQCWMAKNMNIGTMVNATTGQTDNFQIEKYCYNGLAENCEQYGGLYKWDEAMQYITAESSRGICPEGWHIPSDLEWITLEEALGMTHATASLVNQWRGTGMGTKLLAGGSSGYNALLSGRTANGSTYDLLNQYEFMYSSTAYLNNAWRRCLRTGDTTIGRWNTFPKYYALSVRCVKN